jgi:hypothetical protein
MVACTTLIVAVGAAGCSGGPSTAAGSSSTQPTTNLSGTSGTSPLKAPATSATDDAAYLSEVTEADPPLATYEQKHGNVALRALLTDGSGFCALLGRGGGVDKALVDLAVGARSDEAHTHLPLKVTTFNAIEAVALLTLCPSEQRFLPAADQTKIRQLGAALAGRSATSPTT